MPPSAQSPVIARDCATPIVDVSTTWVVTRSSTARSSAATVSDARPSGRLHTIRSVARATSATEARWSTPSGARAGPAASCPTTAKPAPRRFVASALPMLPSPTTPTALSTVLTSPTLLSQRANRTAGGHARRGTAVRDQLEEQLVDLGVGHSRVRARRGVEAELLHAAERRGHRQHQQTAVLRRQRAVACPHAPCGRGEVVLELDRGRVGVGRDRVDVLVAEHRST